MRNSRDFCARAPRDRSSTCLSAMQMHLRKIRIDTTMMNLSDYLVDWAEQVRALAEQQDDRKMQKKLVALAEECGRITMLMEPESRITRLH
jgi:hypothetical protein